MNIGAISQSSTVQRSTSVGKAEANTRPSSEGTNKSDSVNLSMAGRALSELPPLMLPTRENVQQLASKTLDDLNKLFREAGIDVKPPVQFDKDAYTGALSIKGNRPDIQKIAELVKSNRNVELEINNLAAISSHVDPLARAMEAGNAVGAAKNDQEAAKIIAKYADVFGHQRRAVDFSVVFSGADIQINADGKAWMRIHA